ncbi:MAG: UDP-N-acetylglucosamine--LPS N-acetylglucosamine transferase [Desulfobacteraceae bacterium]|nr:UDP-N-acetylglucosamine--LPS N-acetylglucosamine transferase [Desulfobacteraceae bacterium]
MKTSKQSKISVRVNNQRKLKVGLVASAGGHLNQLLKLADSWTGHETFYITTTEVVRNKLSKLGKTYVVGECNHQHPWRAIKVLLRCIRAVFRERPDVVISTGAAAGCITCFLGKLIGARVVWIDSITNVERLSLSGRMVRHIADLFLVQWPELAEQYSNVEYVGAVI